MSYTEDTEEGRASAQDRFFDIDHLHSDLKGRTIRGALINVGSNSTKFFLHMVSTVVLARLLTPKDYGIFGMVIAVTGFVGMFRDMGLSWATIQKARIDHAQTSNLFWVNVGLSIGIMVITASLAPFIAKFYGEPRLTWITLALAGGFVISGLSVQHQALLRRQMRFSVLAVIDISAMFLGVTAGILAGVRGWGYWALVCMQLTFGASTTVLSWVLCRWRPGLPHKNTGIRSMLSFGGNLTVYNFLNYFARNLDNVLIGKYLGPAQLGLYSKAYNLLLMPLEQISAPITHVGIPALSRLQNDPDSYRRFYCRALSAIAYLTIPLVAVMAALSDEIIFYVLGSRWMEASPIFRILVIAAVIQPMVNQLYWIYISLGQADRMMKVGLFTSPLYVLAFIIGLKWGAIGVAASYAIISYALFIPVLWIAIRYSPVHMVDVFHNTWKPIVMSFILFLIISVTKSLPVGLNLLMRTVTSMLVGFIFMAITFYYWPAVRKEVYGLVELIRESNRS